MRDFALPATVAILILTVPGVCLAGSDLPRPVTGPKASRPSAAPPRSNERQLAPTRGVPGLLAQQPTTPERKIPIRDVKITGATVFPAEELQALVASAKGKAMTMGEIEALAAEITRYYRSRGYLLARAYVPPQQIKDDTVEIAVLEGRIGKVEVQGAKWYSPERLESYVAPREDQPVFHSRRHETGMLLLNDLPGLRVESALRPGTEVGTSDIVLNVTRDRLITGSVETNNYGSRLTGRYRFGGSLELNSPTGLGDVLSARGVVSDELEDTWFVRGGYTFPLTKLGTKVGGAFTHAESAVGREFAVLGITGSGDLASVFIAHPVVRTQPLSLFVQAGFDYKNFETQVLGERANEDTLSVANLALTLESVDPWRGLTSTTLSLQRGIPEFLGSMRAFDDPNASREGAGGEFTKLVGSIARLQQIYGPTSFFAKASGQWTEDKLVSPEQFIAGGAGIVRGYPIAELSGDRGFTLTGEFRWNAPGFASLPAFGGKTWGDLVQVFGFVDHGEVRVLDPLPGQRPHRDITGAGGGIRLGFPNIFHLSVEYARPLGDRPSDRVDEFVYFQAIAWF